jgi:hypothetical protein
MCVAFATNGSKKQKPVNANHKKPKKAVTILLLRKTAITRKKNKADVDETVRISTTATAMSTASQLGKGAAVRM